MQSSWQTETGPLACHWSNGGQRRSYDSRWMQEAAGFEGHYLPPIPDFASHSPVYWPSWFQPSIHTRDPE